MIITDRKIEVTEQMMFDEGLSKYGRRGVPASQENKTPITWKKQWELELEDLEKIERYFLALKDKIG